MAEIDLTRLTTHSLHPARRLVKREQAGTPVPLDGPLGSFLDALPDVLAARDLRTLARAVVEARRRCKPVLVQFGGHVIKCGVVPFLVDLVERGFVTALATNGAGAIHDVEMAMVGATSEDVAGALEDGSFGMAREPAEFMAEAAVRGAGVGFGQAVGELLNESDWPHRRESLLARAVAWGRQVTVHVAIGTDVTHHHPGLDAASLGQALLKDFRKYCGVVAELGGGGVVVNLGSAVILPEVFLKAVSIARNLGYPVEEFTAANVDMIRHYRPSTNILGRPLQRGGVGINIVGHHELMVPLLHAMILRAAQGGRSEA